MSRTIRRRNTPVTHFGHRDDHICDFLWEDGSMSCFVRITPDKHSKVYKSRMARFMSDSGPVCNAPAVARKIEERKYRGEAKREVQKFLKNTDHEVQVNKAFRCVNWYFF